MPAEKVLCKRPYKPLLLLLGPLFKVGEHGLRQGRIIGEVVAERLLLSPKLGRNDALKRVICPRLLLLITHLPLDLELGVRFLPLFEQPEVRTRGTRAERFREVGRPALWQLFVVRNKFVELPVVRTLDTRVMQVPDKLLKRWYFAQHTFVLLDDTFNEASLLWRECVLYLKDRFQHVCVTNGLEERRVAECWRDNNITGALRRLELFVFRNKAKLKRRYCFDSVLAQKACCRHKSLLKLELLQQDGVTETELIEELKNLLRTLKRGGV